MCGNDAQWRCCCNAKVGRRLAYDGCRVLGVSVTPPSQPGLDIDAHRGDVPIQLVDVDATHFSCVDARAAHEVVSTPAGDIGEFLVALRVYENMCLGGKQAGDAETLRLMTDFVDAHAQPLRPFYMHSDDAGMAKLLQRMGWNQLPVSMPTGNTLTQFWSVIFDTNPANRVHGCGHLWFQLVSPSQYNTTTATLQAGFKAYFTLLFDPMRNSSMFFEVVHSTFDAWGIAAVTQNIVPSSPSSSSGGGKLRGSKCPPPETCETKTALLTPRLRPKGAPADNARDWTLSSNGQLGPQKDVFAYHPTAVDKFRTGTIVPFFLSQPACRAPPSKKNNNKPKTVVTPAAFLKAITDLASLQLTTTVGKLETSFGRKLPIFNLKLDMANAAP